MQTKIIRIITQTFLLSVIAIVPFVFTSSLYFPYVSGKAYLFRVLVAAALFFWIWLLLKDPSTLLRVKKNFKNILVIAALLFFLAQVLASFFGVDPGYSFFSSIERAEGVAQYGFWILYFLMFVSVFRSAQDWKKFFSVFIITAFFISAFSWLTRVLPESSSIVTNNQNLFGYQEQLFGIFGNPAYFAAFLLFAIGFSLIAYERKFFHSGPVHYALLVVAGIFVLTLVFTQVRGVYVGLAGGIVFFSFLSLLFLRKERKKIAFAGGVVLLAGVLSFSVLFLAKDSDFVQERRFLWRITEVANFWESDSVRERVLNWSIALKAFAERPVFGYGPENFGAAANKYYDYRIGKGEPWFDRAHNQAFDTLATAGMVGFAGYVFWLGTASFIIYKIAKRQKVFGFLLAGMFVAYFLQGFFLFDLLAVYLGLFPLLAFLIYQSYPVRGKPVELAADFSSRENRASNGAKYIVLVPAALASLFVIYTTVFVPYQANAAALKFYAYSENGLYKESMPFLEKAFSIESPYASWEVRKRIGWQFSNVLEYGVNEDTKPETLPQLEEMYRVVAPELERFLDARPTDPQMYYVLGRIYRLGYEKLGFDDLGKAGEVFQKAFEHSDLRVEYYNEFSKVLLLQEKFEDAERILKDYAARMPSEWGAHFPSLTLGHFYFTAKEYAKALEQYEKAREAGYQFVEMAPEYSRYLFAAEETGNYAKVIDMAKAYLAKHGPDADTYFNLAVSYFHLEEKEKAKDFFLKSVELKSEYEEYRPFFIE